MGSLTEKLSSSVWRVCGKSVAKVASIVMLRNLDEVYIVFSLLCLSAVFNCSWFDLRRTVQFGFVNVRTIDSLKFLKTKGSFMQYDVWVL